MWTGRLVAAAVAALPVSAAWAGPAEICAGAGFQAGSASFESCVGSVAGDPMAGLEPAPAHAQPAGDDGGEVDVVEKVLEGLTGRDGKTRIELSRLDDSMKGGTKTFTGMGTLPISEGGGSFGGPAPLPSSSFPSMPGSAPSNNGGPAMPQAPVGPTQPTSPDLPVFISPAPVWNWGYAN